MCLAATYPDRFVVPNTKKKKKAARLLLLSGVVACVCCQLISNAVGQRHNSQLDLARLGDVVWGGI